MDETKPAAGPKPKKKHGCLVTFVILLLVIVILALIIEFVAPLRIESMIGDETRQSLQLYENPVVKIEAHPLLVKLFQGRIDTVYIKAKDVDAKGLAAESIEIDLKGVDFDPVKLLQTRQPAVDSIEEGTAKVVMSEKTVNDIADDQLPGSKVTLEKDRIKYSGDLSYMLPGFTYTITGTVSVKPDNVLAFQPNLQEVAGLPVPDEIKEYLGNALAIEYRVLELPEGITLTGVKMAPGKMTLEASVESVDEIISTVMDGG